MLKVTATTTTATPVAVVYPVASTSTTTVVASSSEGLPGVLDQQVVLLLTIIDITVYHKDVACFTAIPQHL